MNRKVMKSAPFRFWEPLLVASESNHFVAVVAFHVLKGDIGNFSNAENHNRFV
jgi:hypothetical protein